MWTRLYILASPGDEGALRIEAVEPERELEFLVEQDEDSDALLLRKGRKNNSIIYSFHRSIIYAFFAYVCRSVACMIVKSVC